MSDKTKIKVLIADDSAVVRRRVVALIKELKEVDIVDQVADGLAAVEAVRTLKPDVVILDIIMPGLSGLKVLRTIAQEAPLPEVIMLTNYPLPQYRRKCREAGARYFFDKSADFEKLPQVIERVYAEKSGISKQLEHSPGT